MVIKRRQVPASGVSGYYLVYILEEDGQEVEIGRTVWNDNNTLLRAVNTYEEGLLAGLKVFYDKQIEIIREK
ncbi:MAG: hypothetical protein Q7K65_01915 [Candidatus Buchananbacteria bacterium]|nr:hypothetical protein [Candidatus Buchananbacteria bacterium]